MRRQATNTQTHGPAARATETRPAARPGEFVARAVALIGGASLVIGGALGYAFGYLEGLRDKGDDHEV